MKLTRKKAIELCIELWTWLAETGAKKRYWPKWAEYGNAAFNCPFCEYSRQQAEKKGEGYLSLSDTCPYCPFGGKQFRCNSLYFNDWKIAQDEDEKDITKCKKYAKLFLGQIKELK